MQSYLQSEMFLSNSVDMMKNLQWDDFIFSFWNFPDLYLKLKITVCKHFKHFSLHLKIFAEYRSNTTLGKEVRTKLETLRQTFQEEIRPVWKKEFISLYCFLPWYVNYFFPSLISKTEREKTLRVSKYCFLPSYIFETVNTFELSKLFRQNSWKKSLELLCISQYLNNSRSYFYVPT